MRPALPVDATLPDLVTALRHHGAAVLLAPTGAGKTTRVPPALLDAGLAGDGTVMVLEPRRVAARAAARRIAAERGVRLGEEVGYHVRFDHRATARTRLLVVTEGVLLRRLQDDPFLEGVGAVMLDEFHERSLSADLALALLRRVRDDVRPDLRIVVTSATLDPGPVAAYLHDAPVLRSEGRLHPVAIEHGPPASGADVTRAVRSAVLDALPRTTGDLLVFLPGVGEIRRCASDLRSPCDAHGADVLELHGDLPPERQDAALEPGPRRRVILATNVAETSLTIEGVTTVIDAGLERLPRLDPARGLERLETVRISRESADQRAGRAGRTGPGLCVRLWGRGEDAGLAPRRLPEVQRADLAAAALELHAWGETDLVAFPWFEAPPAAALAIAEQLLHSLGALQDGRLTDAGRAMAALPVHPRLARLLVSARDVGHARRLALAAAALSDRPPWARFDAREPAAHVGPSDVLDLVESLEAFERSGRTGAGIRPLRHGPARFILAARDQLARLVGNSPARGVDRDEAVLRAVHAAYADRLAGRRSSGSDRGVLVDGGGVRVAASSAVQDAALFVCVDADAGQRGRHADALVRTASAVRREWLPDDLVTTTEDLTFDATREAVAGVRRTTCGAIVLDEVAVPAPRGPDVERVLVAAAANDIAGALALDDPAVASLRDRVAFLRASRPDLDVPALDDDALLALLPDLARGRRSFAELRRAPLLDHLRGRLQWPHVQALDREAPERLRVPSGSQVRLRYEAGRPPVLAVRIQEMFGQRETPTLAGGRVKVLLHLLAPNNRPQQVTDDLPSFWANTYALVRAELRRRYPKHAWPEDPLTAEPQRRPTRRR